MSKTVSAGIWDRYRHRSKLILTNCESAKEQAILVPGAGNAYEVGYLHEQGFTNVTLVDFAPAPIAAFAERYPDFPVEHLICADFFELSPEQYQFDWVLEQTFLCDKSITP